ncbi:MAG TPA: hypothetical protein VMF58_10930 [Rhizomicrobium sp.]|nr:hypothetical protein [Rhizomicrobium sp.]
MTARHTIRIAAALASTLVLSCCVNDSQRAIEIAQSTCTNDWAFLRNKTSQPPTAQQSLWHAQRDGDGWLAWDGADEKNPGDVVHVSRFGPIHSECRTAFQD